MIVIEIKSCPAIGTNPTPNFIAISLYCFNNSPEKLKPAIKSVSYTEQAMLEFEFERYRLYEM